MNFTRQGLASSYDHYQLLLKIRETQRKRKVHLLQTNQLHYLLREEGPKALERGPSVVSTSFEEAEVQQLAEFWKSVWEVRGTYSPHHHQMGG